MMCGEIMCENTWWRKLASRSVIACVFRDIFLIEFVISEFCLLNEQQGGFERENAEGSTSPHSVLFRDTSFLFHPDAVDNGMYSGAENPVPSHASLSVLKKGIARNVLHDYITGS